MKRKTSLLFLMLCIVSSSVLVGCSDSTKTDAGATNSVPTNAPPVNTNK